MTIRELLEVNADTKKIFIKPNGRRCYYDGTTDDIPEILKDAVIEELAPKVCHAEYDSPKRYDSSWGVWIGNIPILDAIADSSENKTLEKDSYGNYRSGKEIDELVKLFQERDSYHPDPVVAAAQRILCEDMAKHIECLDPDELPAR